MQIPSNIPKPTAPTADTKVEPIARVAPVVMGDAAARIDPSILLRTPVPVSAGPKQANTVRPATDHRGPLYISPEQAEDSEAAAYIAALSDKLIRAEAGPQAVRWPLPKELAAQQQREYLEKGRQGPLSKSPQEAMEMLRLGLERSPMLALAKFAEVTGVKKDRQILNRAENGNNNSAATITAAQALQSVPPSGAEEVQQGLMLLMHGQLFWQGEFTPGVNAKIYRQDAYEEDPRTPGGPLVKGAQIAIEVELPTLGVVVVRGRQIAGSINVWIEPKRAKELFARHLPELREQLNAAHLESVNLRLESSGQKVVA